MLVQVSQLNLTVGDLEGNPAKVLQAIERARTMKVDIVLFSELTLVGYPPEDLLLDGGMIDRAQHKLREMAPATKGMFVAVGLPRRNPRRTEKPLYNSVAVFIDGQLVGFKDKTLLPTYDVFDERRFFEPGEGQPVFAFLGKRIGITICEDAWQHAGGVGDSNYRCDPIRELCDQGIDLMLNLTASPYSYKREDKRIATFEACAKTLRCPVIVCNQVGANDQIVFDGHSFCVDEKGDLIALAKGFVEEDLLVDLSSPSSPCPGLANATDDLYRALVIGVRDYFHKQGFSKAILGLSGGIDSAVVACIAKEALGASNVSAIYLPSRYSSPESYRDAELLASNLRIELQKISIDELFEKYLDTFAPFFHGCPENITAENLQSRIRGHVLMAFSNQFGSLLLNTGNKSEMAMGYTTLYGDMAGGLGVLQDVTKLRVYQLAKFANRQRELIPASILSKPPSAELRPDQTDQDTLPPFEVLDPILEDYLEERLSPQEIADRRGAPLPLVLEIIHKIHTAEYKRRQAPIGIRVTQKAFSRGRQVPIVQKWM